MAIPISDRLVHITKARLDEGIFSGTLQCKKFLNGEPCIGINEGCFFAHTHDKSKILCKHEQKSFFGFKCLDPKCPYLHEKTIVDAYNEKIYTSSGNDTSLDLSLSLSSRKRKATKTIAAKHHKKQTTEDIWYIDKKGTNKSSTKQEKAKVEEVLGTLSSSLDMKKELLQDITELLDQKSELNEQNKDLYFRNKRFQRKKVKENNILPEVMEHLYSVSKDYNSVLEELIKVQSNYEKLMKDHEQLTIEHEALNKEHTNTKKYLNIAQKVIGDKDTKIDQLNININKLKDDSYFLKHHLFIGSRT